MSKTVQELTDKNFDQTLKEHDIVVVDFYAVWCVAPETLLITEKGVMRASDVRNGDQLLVVDPVSHTTEIKSVIKSGRTTKMKSIEVELETGRTICGDVNHQVMTRNGFKKLSELTTEDEVLVYLTGEA